MRPSGLRPVWSTMKPVTNDKIFVTDYIYARYNYYWLRAILSPVTNLVNYGNGHLTSVTKELSVVTVSVNTRYQYGEQW
jgi:hypothetical protein